MNTDDEPLFSSRHNPETMEANFGDAFGGDPESLENARLTIRSLASGDVAAIARIDRRASGRDRFGYIAQKAAEVLEQSGVRISLVAEDHGMPIGFIMARLDYGEFGRTSPAAVIDTIGVDPGYHDVGRALMGQLAGNLRSLRVDGMRTIVRWDDGAMTGFLARNGFAPAERLALRCAL